MASEVPSSSRWRPRRVDLHLFLISFATLFFELACIRWFGSTVLFLTFFTNLILMACFLGISVGCLAASRPRDLINAVLPLTVVAMALGWGTLWAYHNWTRVTIDVGSQQSPQQIFFGTENRPNDPSQFVVPIEWVAGLFFVLVALMFLGLGQELGRLFNAAPHRVVAYTMNILGSLAGIAGFGIASWYRTPPLVWFAIGGGLCLLFTTRRHDVQVAWFVALLGLLFQADAVEGAGHLVWSPYYKVQYSDRDSAVFVNNILHQMSTRVDVDAPAYALPHLLNRDAGGRTFEDVLIIGAGTGNDVAAALAAGAKHVDAVEIDPVINGIGRALHPNRPYDDERVTVHLDDGRGFVGKIDRKYDLVIYALVDSLVMHSGYSSLRLESFLFTEQAFRDVRAKLKPGGVFAVYNYFRQGWVVARLAELATRSFGAEPIVFSMPYQAKVQPGDTQIGFINFLLAGEEGNPNLDRIRKSLAEERFFWANKVPRNNDPVNAYGPTPPRPPGALPRDWNQIGPAEVDTAGVALIPTDDWPFLYLREATIPTLNLRGMAMVAVLSLMVLWWFAPPGARRPDGRMFFLGAGFMLLETKGVVHMALLFGSTWVVNSIVIAAILVMILLSNLTVLAIRPRRLGPVYALLIVALLVNVLIPMREFLALSGAARLVASCAVTFLPIFFAGIVFAVTFRDHPHPDVAFGSNIAGAILGGLSEYASLMVGFNALLVLAIAYYVLSAVLGRRSLGVATG